MSSNSNKNSSASRFWAPSYRPRVNELPEVSPEPASSPNDSDSLEKNVLDVNMSFGMIDDQITKIKAENSEKRTTILSVENELKNAYTIKHQQLKDTKNLTTEILDLFVDSESRLKDLQFQKDVVQKLQEHALESASATTNETYKTTVNNRLVSLVGIQMRRATLVERMNKIIDNEVKDENAIKLLGQRYFSLRQEITRVRVHKANKLEKIHNLVHDMTGLEKRRVNENARVDQLRNTLKEKLAERDALSDKLASAEKCRAQSMHGAYRSKQEQDAKLALIEKDASSENSKATELAKTNGDADGTDAKIVDMKEKFKTLRQQSTKLFTEKTRISDTIIENNGKRDTSLKSLFAATKIMESRPEKEAKIRQLEATALSTATSLDKYRELKSKYNRNIETMPEVVELKSLEEKKRALMNDLEAKSSKLESFQAKYKESKAAEDSFKEKHLNLVDEGEQARTAAAKEFHGAESTLKCLVDEIDAEESKQRDKKETLENDSQQYSEHLDSLRRVEIVSIAHKALSVVQEKSAKLVNPKVIQYSI